jgi:hypothetical protein
MLGWKKTGAAGGAGSPAPAPAAGGAGGKAPSATAAPKTTLRGARRRLSVVSDNKLIEGIATIGAADAEDVMGGGSESVVRTFAGVSKKGYAPYNPRKRNQDAILMEEHKATNTLLFGVCDGHGEAGDLVSHYFVDRIAARVVAHPKWISDCASAMREELLVLEDALLAG